MQTNNPFVVLIGNWSDWNPDSSESIWKHWLFTFSPHLLSKISRCSPLNSPYLHRKTLHLFSILFECMYDDFTLNPTSRFKFDVKDTSYFVGGIVEMKVDLLSWHVLGSWRTTPKDTVAHDLSSHGKHELAVVVQNQYSLFIRFYKGLYAFDKNMFVFLPKILLLILILLGGKKIPNLPNSNTHVFH